VRTFSTGETCCPTTQQCTTAPDSYPCTISEDASKSATTCGFDSLGHWARCLFNVRDKHANNLTVSLLENFQAPVTNLHMFKIEMPVPFLEPGMAITKSRLPP
jgi:hypothetical protein